MEEYLLQLPGYEYGYEAEGGGGNAIAEAMNMIIPFVTSLTEDVKYPDDTRVQ